jgi:CHRD domain
LKKLAPIIALGAAALAVSGVATGATHTKSMTKMTFTAVLNVGQEKPVPKGTKSGAAGKFTATVSGTTVTWKLTFSHLTGPATAAHIHAAKKGVPGPVIVPLCGPCKSPASGTGTVTATQLTQMKNGGTYVNVHTAKNAGGEIRGQIKMAM